MPATTVYPPIPVFAKNTVDRYKKAGGRAEFRWDAGAWRVIINGRKLSVADAVMLMERERSTGRISGMV